MDSGLIYSFVTYYCLLAILMPRIFHPLEKNFVAKAVVLIVPVILLLIPVNGMPIIYYLRGAFGDLSIFTICLLVAGLSNQYFKFTLLDKTSLNIFYYFIFFSGCLFYITSLGIGQFDPYSIGYLQTALPITLLAFSLINVFRNDYNLGVLLVLPVIAFYLEILESTNAWDYVLDPFLWLYAGGISIGNYVASIKKKHLPS